MAPGSRRIGSIRRLDDRSYGILQTKFAASFVLSMPLYSAIWGSNSSRDSSSTCFHAARSKSVTTEIWRARDFRDRKSTRLNSSHEWISYAVFCLKKNNNAAHVDENSDIH